MTDERIKQLMEYMGMSDSCSLLTLIRQIENEVTQEIFKKYNIDPWEKG